MRSWGRQRQIPPLLARAGTAPLRGPGAPRRGGPAAPRPHQPTRGNAAGDARVPQKPAKPGPGQQLGHVPAPKGTDLRKQKIKL